MITIRLGDYIHVKHGYPFDGNHIISTDNGIVLTTPGNFTLSGGFKEDNGKFYDGEYPEEYVLESGTLIVTMTDLSKACDTLGFGAIVPAKDYIYLHNQRIGVVSILNETVICKEYLYWVMRSKTYRQRIVNTASGGSTVHHTSPEKIYDVVIDIPDTIEEQKLIASVLSCFDDKVKNNNTICADLEAMAKLLYDYWFVQFDFPDENGKPYKSSGGKMVWNEDLKREIPEGWEVKRLEGMYVIERGVSYTSDDISSGAGVPMINLACVDRSRNYRDGELKYYNGKISEDAYLRGGDLLIACTDLTREREIIGCPILVPDDSIRYTYSMDMAKISFPSSTVNELYMYMALRTDYYHDFIKAWASGTNVLHLNLEGLDWYTMCIPPKPLQDRFAGIIHDIHSKKSEVLVENQQLTSLRDFLLPMLMNGQVKVGGKDDLPPVAYPTDETRDEYMVATEPQKAYDAEGKGV